MCGRLPRRKGISTFWRPRSGAVNFISLTSLRDSSQADIALAQPQFQGQIRRMRSFLLIFSLFLLVVIGGGFLALGMFPLPLHQHQVHEVLPTSAIDKS